MLDSASMAGTSLLIVNSVSELPRCLVAIFHTEQSPSWRAECTAPVSVQHMMETEGQVPAKE